MPRLTALFFQRRKARPKVAHGETVDQSPERRKPRTGRKNKHISQIFSAAPAGAWIFDSRIPRLTPWAIFFRCSAARIFFLRLNTVAQNTQNVPRDGGLILQ
jgi:hypothetical protein